MQQGLVSSLRYLLKPGGPFLKASQATRLLLMREPARRFSTAGSEGGSEEEAPSSDPCLQSPPKGSEEEAPPSDPFLQPPPKGLEEESPPSDPFLQPPPKGFLYGRLTGIGRNALKTDVIHFFEGCNLTIGDIKVDYDGIYTALGMVLQFSSRVAFDMAVRLNTRKGRLYRLEKVDRRQWDQCTTYDGTAVLLQGIPRPASAEEIERFLSGCNFDASSIQTFIRPAFPDPIRLALVRFQSQVEAMNAFRVKNRGFCLNSPIMMRVLQ